MAVKYLRTSHSESGRILFRFLATAIVLSAMGHHPAFADFLYTGFRNDGITRIDERTGEVVQRFAEEGFRDFYGMALGPDGLLYVSAFNTQAGRFGQRGIYRFDPISGTYVDMFLASTWIDAISFDRQGNLYALNRLSNSLGQYDGTSGEYVRTVLSGSDFQVGVGTFAIGEGGELFASTDASKLARYDLATGQRIGPVTDLEQLGLPGYRFDQMTFGPDGKLYAAYNYRSRDQVLDGGIMIFDSATGELLDILVDDLPAFGAANGGSLGVAFGPAGDLYVGSQYAGTIMRLDGTSFQPAEEFPLLNDARSASFIVFLPVPEPRGVLVGTLALLLVVARKTRK